MYYNVEIGHWLSGCYQKQKRHGYLQIPGSAISAETNHLIAQNVHGSKLVTQGKHSTNLKVMPYHNNEIVTGSVDVMFSTGNAFNFCEEFSYTGLFHITNAGAVPLQGFMSLWSYT
jgi:hypothetical protein